MKDAYFFVHGGDRVELANAELRALVKTYHSDAIMHNLNERVSIIEGSIDLQKITSRTACTKYAGHMISESINIELGYFKNYRRFACRMINLSSRHVSMDKVSEVGKQIKEKMPWMQVSLDNPDVTVLYIVTDNGSIIGINELNHKKHEMNRPYFHPVALEPRLSRIMVNLTMARENYLLLDPFCGTGSIVLEAYDMNIRAIGCDLSVRMCYGANENMRNTDNGIINCDALALPLQTSKINTIATDLPYGRSASTMKRAAKTLLKEFVSFVNGEMRGKRCCVMCRKGDEQIFDNMIEEYDIYEHKSLTRKLMVLCS